MSEHILDYDEREKLKQEGWKNISDDNQPHKNAYYFLHYIIKAHYWRAREALESTHNYRTFLRKIVGKKYSPGYELDIDHYTEHWLHANKHLMNEATLQYFIDWFYSPKESKYLPKGHTTYIQYNSERLSKMSDIDFQKVVNVYLKDV